MPDKTPCQIRCKVCGQWADSRNQFSTAAAFFSSELVDHDVTCTWCGEVTPCAVDDMRFYERKEGEFIGTFVEGGGAARGGSSKKERCPRPSSSL